MNIQRLRHAFFHRWLSAHDIRFSNPRQAFGLGGTAKSRKISHFRAHRRRVNETLALGSSKVHRLVRDL